MPTSPDLAPQRAGLLPSPEGGRMKLSPRGAQNQCATKALRRRLFLGEPHSRRWPTAQAV